MPAFPKGTCNFCGELVPKNASFCPGTDHYDQYIKRQGKVTAVQKAEEKKLTVASRKVTEETFVNIEERRTVTRAEMYFLETQEQLQQARKDGQEESPADKFENFATRYGSVAIPLLLVFAIGWDVGQFLYTHGSDQNWYSIIPVLAIAILFEGMLALLTFNLRNLRRDIKLAAEASKAALEADFKRAQVGWWVLAFISCVAQFAAITGMNFTNFGGLLGIVVAIRVVGTTGCDYAVAMCIAPRVRTVAMKVAEMKQEAKELKELAGAMKERLEAEKEVRTLFLETPQSGKITDVQEVK